MAVFPTDWYWIVGDDETRAYSSAAGDYVPASEVPAQGITRIANEQELGEVLVGFGLSYEGLAYVPPRVSRMQARAVLRREGLFADIDAAIRASDDDDLIGMWDDASHYHRDHEKLVAFWIGAGRTLEQLDQLFSAAGLVA